MQSAQDSANYFLDLVNIQPSWLTLNVKLYPNTITMNLMAQALILCHTIYWNIVEDVGCVWNEVFGVLYSQYLHRSVPNSRAW